MYPTLFSIGIFDFHTYTVAMAIAFLVGVLLPVRENYKRAEPYPATPIGGLWVFFGGLLGARVYWILQYEEGWEKITHLYHALFVWQGGLVFYGGVIGGLIGGFIYLRAKRIPFVPVADITLPYVPLAHAIARVGCFLNGCCWGAPTTMPWGIAYPKRSWGAYAQQLDQHLIAQGAQRSMPVHPTQLYSIVGLLLIFAAMRYAYKRQKHPGAVALLYPLLYGAMRFVVECFRGDYARPLLGMTASQVIALAMFLGAGTAFIMLKRSRWRYSPGESVDVS